MYGKPLEPIRQWLKSRSKSLFKLFGCSYCIGFWSGLIIALIIQNYYILLPLASCGFSGILGLLAKKLED